MTEEQYTETNVGATSDEPNHQPEFDAEAHPFSVGDDQSEEVEQRIQLGLHPLGGIHLLVRGADGSLGQARIGPEEAWRLSGHLQTLTTMLIMNAYAQAQAMAEQNQIYVPAGQNKVFVPGG